MAKHLDLEEQEQLAELRHFWTTYGNVISWVLIVVFGAVAAWNGWQYWQRTQAAQAAFLYDEVERAARAGDVPKVERAFADIKDKFGSTTYAQQAGLLAARTLADKGNSDGAKAALGWVAEKSSDEGYRTLARLRLAGLLVEAKSYDEALKLLVAPVPAEFDPLVADRKGDIHLLQGNKTEAKSEYTKAWKGLDERAEYRRLVEIKLSALGVDTKSLAPATATATVGASKS